MYRTGSLRSPSLRREARHIPPRNVATSSRPPTRRQKLRRQRVAWGPLPSWASGRWPSRRGNRVHVGLWASPGQAGPVGVFAPRHAACRAPRSLALAAPARSIWKRPLKRFSDRLLRVAGQFAHPRSKPICNGERCFGRGSAHSETRTIRATRRADAHGNGVDSSSGGGRAEASPAKIKSTEQNRTLCVRMPLLRQKSHNAVFCSPPLPRDRNSHAVSRFRRLPFLSVATAIQD